ncbi:DUF3710 domain-containing protein [Pedococcus sp. 2YAF34]|uniref:DUF3710 domain-containing protein n=1 Tax=Pedococcus sp. 2YAF34 TaxID=3233032 RepID=UPI003F9435F0
MALFRRGKKTEPADGTGQVADTGSAAEGVDGADAAEAAGVLESAEQGSPATTPAGDEAAGGGAADGRGPFDSSEVDAADDGRLDLGALRIRGVAGMELRLEVDEAADQVVGATAVLGDSAVQIQAFAAPRTLGIWDEIRAEIAESILDQGGTADEVRGPLGTELRTRMPSAGPDGRTVFAPARFAGVDGPRWFLRAVFSGRAAIDDEAAAPLLDVVRDAVVVRGDSAMAPREMLPLTLPAQPGAAADHDDQHDHEHADDEGGTGVRADDLKPFERGPEITEVR